MRIVFIVEEPSMEEALNNIASIVLGREHTFETHNMGNKSSLLKKLPDRLRGFNHWIPDDWRIVVLIDEDRSDCYELKGKLETIANDVGMATKSRPRGEGSFRVMNRIVIEELEAWFFGDTEALMEAYPGVPASLGEQSRFRDPDAIAGGTWEALERVLQGKGYFKGGLAKIEAARAISQHMDPDRNRSKSFQVFRDGLKEIVGATSQS